MQLFIHRLTYWRYCFI